MQSFPTSFVKNLIQNNKKSFFVILTKFFLFPKPLLQSQNTFKHSNSRDSHPFRSISQKIQKFYEKYKNTLATSFQHIRAAYSLFRCEPRQIKAKKFESFIILSVFALYTRQKVLPSGKKCEVYFVHFVISSNFTFE